MKSTLTEETNQQEEETRQSSGNQVMKGILKFKFSNPLSLFFYTIIIYGFIFVLSYFLLLLSNLVRNNIDLPLQHLFSGLAFIFLAPVSGIPISIFLAVSVVLYQKAQIQGIKAGIILVNSICILTSSLWGPNPFFYWPISILGDHKSRVLIQQLFPNYIVDPDYAIPIYGDDILDWQITEFLARMGVIFIGWIIFFVILYWLVKQTTKTVPVSAIGGECN